MPATNIENSLSYIVSDYERPLGPPPTEIARLERHFQGTRVDAPQAMLEVVADTRLAAIDPKDPPNPPNFRVLEALEQRFDLLRKGSSFLLVFGELRYRDSISKDTHITKWCGYLRDNASSLNDPPKWGFSACEEFNGMN